MKCFFILSHIFYNVLFESSFKKEAFKKNKITEQKQFFFNKLNILFGQNDCVLFIIFFQSSFK